MEITQEDYQKARRISRAIQEYLETNRINEARSPEIYEMLAKKDLIQKDRHQGIHFRRFLHKLTEHNLLKLIPQCKNKRISDKQMEWFFYPISIDSQNINHVPKPDDSIREVIYVHVPKMSEEEMNNRIGLLRPLVIDFRNVLFQIWILPLNLAGNIMHVQVNIGQKRKMICLINLEEFGNVNKVAQLLLRQPNSVELRLKKCGIIK